MTTAELSPLLIVGGIVMGIAGLGLFIYWIMGMVKSFKAGDTLWGVLTIFLGTIIPIIYGFVKGNVKFAVIGIILTVVFLIGYGVVIGGAVSSGIAEGLESSTLEYAE